MQLLDLYSLKHLLEIDPRDPGADAKLLFLIDFASGWIEELLNRKLCYNNVTEYYKGTGTQKLVLRKRPALAIPTIQVWQDYNGYYGAASGAFTNTGDQLTYGSDFALQIDQDDGISSRSAILIRINDYWQKPFVRQVGYLSPFVGDAFGNIKVIYTAGYTQDTLPAPIRLAMTILVAKLNQLLPYGMFLTSESYEDRAVSYFLPQKRRLMSEVWDLIGTYRNWTF